MTHLPSPAGWNAAIAANDTANTPLDVLAADLIARLATVPSITDMPTCLEEARQLTARIRGIAKLTEAGRGLLGPNGLGPRIENCLRSAAFHGFRRPRLASATERMLAEAL